MPCFDQFDKGNPYPEDIRLDGLKHLFVKAAKDCKPEELLHSIETLVQGAVAEAIAKKGWALPKLETLAQKIETQPYVARIKR